MGVESVTGQSIRTVTSLANFTILVVDDDSTSLTIVSGMLKAWHYQVLTVKNSMDALSTLRVQRDIDLVVTDLHMPGMDGIQLQKQIAEEFKRPVIIMSSDDKENVILESLAGGAVFYIVKPINPNDLKNVWQYAVASRKGKFVAIEEIGSIQGAPSAQSNSSEDRKSASSVNEEKYCSRKGCKRKAPPKKSTTEEDEEENHSTAPKKAKVVWTNSLHNRFLQAIKHIGLEKAVPKRILEFMNIPGLTRENVASHLQKYRLFLKRVAEKGFPSTRNLSERAQKSSFAARHASLLHRSTQKEYPKFSENQQLMRTLLLQPGYGGSNILSTLGATNSSLGQRSFPSQEALSSKSLSQFGFGQSKLLLGSQGNRSRLYQGTPLTFARETNKTGPSLSTNGGLSYDLIMNGTSDLVGSANQMQIYQKQNGGSFTTSGLHGSNYDIIGTSKTPYLNPAYTNSNYAGMRINSNGELIGAGQIQLFTDGCNAGSGSGNGIHNVTAAPTGNKLGTNSTLGYNLAQEGSSSCGFSTANQFQPTLPTNINPRENTSMLPSLPQEQNDLVNGVQQNDSSDCDLINSFPALDNINHLQQSGQGDFGSDLFDELTNYQEQDGQGLLDTNLQNRSQNVEMSHEMNQLLNSTIPNSTNSVEENPPNCNKDEQALSQVQNRSTPNGETGLNNSNVGSDEYDPIFDQNPNQDQEFREFLDSELGGIHQMDTGPSSFSQVWGDDFMDSFLNPNAN